MEEGEKPAWNRFVLAHPDATPHHLFEWSMIVESVYHLHALNLGAFRDDKLVAVLPVTIIRRLLGKERAISQAFCNHAGWLVLEGEEKPEVGEQFLFYLRSIGIHKLELRTVSEEMHTQSTEFTLVRSLPSSGDVLWKELDAKVRNQVRKATKSGLAVRWGADQVDDFYAVYTRKMGGLGSPVHPKSLFREILDRLPSFCNILTVRLGEEAVAAMFVVGFKKELSGPWAASLRQFDVLCANMLLYWEAIRYGSENGYDSFDMGRSRIHSSTYRFKKQWGSKPVALRYEVLSLDGATSTDSTAFYRSDLALFISKIWRALPRPISIRLGPMVRRYMP